ncbi:hypothetical protein [Paenibacillus soyae]|uniref:Uncharacterized protein n=1 Tax=Paenibacillus soyae TaxID=2969249 RepID=A0A9X2MWV7_9BACL|nr:hypothetical protein [Paenibacillus soyae]MCR2807378.1 hypothetical protein [Paenibacillus soyae]
MKKRRQMVMVAPGKDVTLYIPSDTPPEVIRYLNRLKAEGVFSQGIMDILNEHILGRKAAAAAAEGFDSEAGSAPWDAWIDESAAAAMEEAPEPEPSAPDFAPEPPKPFSPEDIIRQATRNAGKLLG